MSLIQTIQNKVIELKTQRIVVTELYCTLGFYELLTDEVKKITPLNFMNTIYVYDQLIKIKLSDITMFFCHTEHQPITNNFFISYSTMQSIPTFTLDEIIRS